jgi:hypothetical protein
MIVDLAMSASMAEAGAYGPGRRGLVSREPGPEC